MIVESIIKQQILNLLDSTSAGELEQAKDTFATQLASIIATAIRSAQVIVNPGIPVATAGSAAAQTGATTATGSGSLQ